MNGQCLELRPEQKSPVHQGIVEGLLAKTITRKMQAPQFPVPDGAREHAVETLQRSFHSPAFECRERHLGIGVSSPVQIRIRGTQLLPQLSVVVDFAVIRDHVASRLRQHRLMTVRRKIDDRQAPMSESHTRCRVYPFTIIVRATMSDAQGHSPRQLGHRVNVRPGAGQKTGQSAHRSSFRYCERTGASRSRTSVNAPSRVARTCCGLPPGMATSVSITSSRGEQA